jgi:glycosyltransferase involved in cell wall biosynthesis
MESLKFVSVAMATYNGEKYLKEQLESIYKQTYKNFEVVVCDDCSTDNTVEILKEFQQKYGLIYYINNTNLGYVKNFEKAINLSSGEYIAISDQDDIWFENKIFELNKTILELEIKYPDKPVLVHSEATVVNSDLQLINKTFIGKSRGKGKGLNNLLFGNSKVQGASVIFNSKFKNLFLPIPDEVQLYDLYASLIIETFGIRYFLPTPLMYYRQHSNNAVGYVKISIKDRVKLFFRFDFIIYPAQEKNSVDCFQHQFKLMLDKNTEILLKNYYFILAKDHNLIKKICKIIKYKFNSNGLITKLLIKVIINHLNKM